GAPATPGARPSDAGAPSRPSLRARCALLEPSSRLAQPPLGDEGGSASPVRLRVRKVRNGRGRVHCSDAPVQPQVVRLAPEAAGLERIFERAVLSQDLGRLLRPDAARAGKLVRRIAAEGDEVGYLLRLDPVALAHLLRPGARELAHAAVRLHV